MNVKKKKHTIISRKVGDRKHGSCGWTFVCCNNQSWFHLWRAVAEAGRHGLALLRLWVWIHFTDVFSAFWNHNYCGPNRKDKVSDEELLVDQWAVLLCCGSNLRFFPFTVQHVKLKAKSVMKSSLPGGEWPGGTGCGSESTVLEKVVQILPCQRWGERGLCPLSMFLRNKYRLLWNWKLCLVRLFTCHKCWVSYPVRYFNKPWWRVQCYRSQKLFFLILALLIEACAPLELTDQTLVLCVYFRGGQDPSNMSLKSDSSIHRLIDFRNGRHHEDQWGISTYSLRNCRVTQRGQVSEYGITTATAKWFLWRQKLK